MEVLEATVQISYHNQEKEIAFDHRSSWYSGIKVQHF